MEEDNYLKIRSRTDCPCGSGKIYHECCRPLHIGKAHAETAEELMRSRYSAYFFRLVDYIYSTTHPNVRGPELIVELDNTINDMMWRKLQILQTSKGSAEDKKGKVEFIAQYHHEGKFHEMHEKSRFRKHKGRWKYLDARG